MKKNFFLLLFAISLTGCASLNDYFFGSAPQVPIINSGQCIYYGGFSYTCNHYEMEIFSNPPGVKIEINNEYIGETPLKKIWNGTYSIYDSYIIKANPNQPGQFVQTKTIEHHSTGEVNSLVTLPGKIYFDMNLGPATPAIDVNVNPN